MRMFIAAELSDQIKDSLCKTIDYLQQHGISGRFTERENLHLTLAFIGESDMVLNAINALDLISAPAIDISLTHAGFFSDLLWVGTNNTDPLTKLAEDIASGLRSTGFFIEERSYLPHITIARKVSQKAKDMPIIITPAKMKIQSISLMRSERINGKQVYSRIYLKML